MPTTQEKLTNTRMVPIDISYVNQSIHFMEQNLAAVKRGAAFPPSHPELVMPPQLPAWSETVTALEALATYGNSEVRVYAQAAYGVVAQGTPVIRRMYSERLALAAQAARKNINWFPKSSANPADSFPATNKILQQQLGGLRTTVAINTAYSKAHRAKVHYPMARASLRRAGATKAAAEAIRGTARGVVRGLVAIDSVVIPRLRRDLAVSVRDLRQAMQRGDAETRRELRIEIRRVVERIGDVVRWLTTDALPAVRELVRAEAVTRTRADTALQRQVQLEAQARQGTDAQILGLLAPIIPFINGPVRTATGKVQRTEGLFDQLLRTDVGWLAALAVPPEFQALLAKVIVPVMAKTPEMFIAFQRAAGQAAAAI